MNVLFSQEPLFSPDIFCEKEPRFSHSSDAALQKKILTVLKQDYGIDAGTDVRLDLPDPVPLNSFIVRIQSASTQLVLKIASEKIPRQSRDTFEKRLRLADDLRRTKRILFPEILSRKDGRLSLSENGQSGYLMRYEGGARYPGGNENDLLAAASSIGDLYAFFRKMEPDPDLPRREYWDGADLEAVSAMQKALAAGLGDEPLKRYGPAFTRHYEKMKKEYDAAGWSQKKPEICHIDLHPHNLLLKDSKMVCILDMEAIQCGNRIICLGFCAFKLLRNYAAVTGSSEKKVNDLREIFVDKLVARGALDADEKPLLALGAGIENLKRFIHGFRGQRAEALRSGPRLALFGRALAGEIEAIYGGEKA